MKKILMKKVFFFSALALFFSCSDENLPDGGGSRNDTELCLKSIAVHNERGGSMSGTISEFTNGDAIGLYLQEYHRGYPFPHAVRENYGWQLSEPVFLSNEPVRLFAYYPFRLEDHANLETKQVDVEHISQTDYMHGQVEGDYVSRNKPYADIVMKHVLALVQFKFIRNDYPHDCSVQRVSINNADGVTQLRSKGVLDLERGDISVKEGCYDKAAITPENMNFNEPYTSEEEYARVLVMPIEPVRNNGELFFEFEIDGHIYTWPVKAGTLWRPGMKYTYEVDMVPMARTLKSSTGTGNIRVVLTQTNSY